MWPRQPRFDSWCGHICSMTRLPCVPLSISVLCKFAFPIYASLGSHGETRCIAKFPNLIALLSMLGSTRKLKAERVEMKITDMQTLSKRHLLPTHPPTSPMLKSLGLARGDRHCCTGVNLKTNAQEHAEHTRTGGRNERATNEHCPH